MKSKIRNQILKSNECTLQVQIELPRGYTGTVLSVCGTEAINEMPSYLIELRLDLRHPGSSAEELVGLSVRFGIVSSDPEPRWRRGIIEEVIERFSAEDAESSVLQLKVVSRVSLLGYSKNYRSFVESPVIKVTQELFEESNIPAPVVRSSPVSTATGLAHRIQIDETDLNFLQRWWEDVGLNYLIEADGTDRVTLFDALLLKSSKIHNVSWKTDGFDELRTGIESITKSTRLITGATRINDFDCTRPAVAIDAMSSSKSRRASGAIRLFGSGAKSREDATEIAKRVQSALDSEQCVIAGSGCLPYMAAGDCLMVSGFKPIRITRFRFDLILEPSPTARCWFEGVEDGIPLAPQLRAERLAIAGTYPALVIENRDPKGLSRIRIRFPWEEEKSPGIWCQVAHANDQVTQPRPGQVVHVAFELADPDRPYITNVNYCSADNPTDPKEENGQTGIRTPHHELLFVDEPNVARLQKHVGGDDVTFVDGNSYSRVDGEMHEHIGGRLFQSSDGDMVVTSGSILTLAASKIVLSDGSNFIILDSSGITINGSLIHLNKPGVSAPVKPARPDPVHAASKGRSRRKLQ